MKREYPASDHDHDTSQRRRSMMPDFRTDYIIYISSKIFMTAILYPWNANTRNVTVESSLYAI